jgi:hypothetical protein
VSPLLAATVRGLAEVSFRTPLPDEALESILATDAVERALINLTERDLGGAWGLSLYNWSRYGGH